jgi:hypothetical protein
MIIKTTKKNGSFICPIYPKNGGLLPCLFVYQLNIN